jgi:hypothetical protein
MGRGIMYSFPCRDSVILSPNVKMFDPLVRNYEVLLNLLFMKWCSSTQSSALYIQPRVLARHFMPINKTVVQYKKNPQVISYLLTNFIWSMIMQ